MSKKPKDSDLEGQTFNGIKVLKLVGKNKNYSLEYECECHCGKVFITQGRQLIANKVKSCGCSRKKKNIKDLTNKRFGRLTVISYDSSDKRGKARWLCKCDCGERKVIDSDSLVRGHTLSCGCYNKEVKYLFGEGKFNPQYNPSLSDEERVKRRNIPEHKNWPKLVKEKYNYTCVICGTKKGPFESHHLNSWDEFPEQRHDVDNGVCLCKRCHSIFHQYAGRGCNTAEEFWEFKQYVNEN